VRGIERNEEIFRHMSSHLDDMYREVILDHYRSPRGKKEISRKDILSKGSNPSCGDELSLQVQIEDGKITDVHVNCQGCAISTASGSMLAETIKGLSFDEVKELTANVRNMLVGEDYTIPEEFSDLDSLEGVRQFPVRIKCALLAWMTLLDGINNYQECKTQESSIISTE